MRYIKLDYVLFFSSILHCCCGMCIILALFEICEINASATSPEMTEVHLKKINNFFPTTPSTNHIYILKKQNKNAYNTRLF